MYCQNCGRQLNETARFCPSCGASTVTGEPSGNTVRQEQSGEPVNYKRKKVWAVAVPLGLLMVTIFTSVLSESVQGEFQTIMDIFAPIIYTISIIWFVIGIFASLHFHNSQKQDALCHYDGRSGRGKDSEVPEEVKRWNWGAMGLTFIWGAYHGVWRSFFVFVPILNIIYPFVLGYKGSEWAWRKNKWKSVEDFKRSRRRWNIAGVISLLILIPMMIIGGLDEWAIKQNNRAVADFTSGDLVETIAQLEDASETAASDYTKMNVLKNLGYAYSSNLEYEKAERAYEEALKYAEDESFEHYLLLGELWLLREKPKMAEENYLKAYQIRPDSFEVNNSLNLFYLNLEGFSALYEDDAKALKYAKRAHENVDPFTDNKDLATENLAIAHFYNNNFGETISLISSIDGGESRPHLAYFLALSHAAVGNMDQAREYLRRAEDGEFAIEPEVYEYIEGGEY